MDRDFLVVLNHTEACRIQNRDEIDSLSEKLAECVAFTVHVTGKGGERGPTLSVFAESGRALVDFLNLETGIKLISRDEACSRRGVVSLRNDDYPDLELDQIEVHYRDLIPTQRAISILRHYLEWGEVIELVPWPSSDEDEWGDRHVVPDSPEPDIPF